MVEPPAHNGLVGGSSPSGATTSKEMKKKMAKKVLSIDRKKILDTIGEHLESIIQWSGKTCFCENVTEYYHKALALIELLEAEDCGSTGGYDSGQPSAKNIFDRWDWLYRKYNNPEKYKKYQSYEEIKEFFDNQYK